MRWDMFAGNGGEAGRNVGTVLWWFDRNMGTFGFEDGRVI